MNQELPKSIRNSLARQARGEVHPSPDVLTSFIERTLSHDERNRVTDHLGLCADCRETVFLASNAAEDITGDNSNELRASAHHQASVKPLRRWAFGLVWASAAVAMLLGGGALVSRFGPVRPERRDASTSSSNTQPASSSPPSAPAMTEQTATTKSAPLRELFRQKVRWLSRVAGRRTVININPSKARRLLRQPRAPKLRQERGGYT